jgi:hypothetical protein
MRAAVRFHAHNTHLTGTRGTLPALPYTPWNIKHRNECIICFYMDVHGLGEGILNFVNKFTELVLFLCKALPMRFKYTIKYSEYK